VQALRDIAYEGGISLEPLPKGASPYDIRQGLVPKEKLDADLKFGLKYLRKMMKR
jgi:hypothetical protein